MKKSSLFLVSLLILGGMKLSQRLYHPALSWPELQELRELSGSSTRGGRWEYRERGVPLLADGTPLRIQFGCGGGSSDYCQVLVSRIFDTREEPEVLLRFGGNCDLFPWRRPRIWLEPPVPGRARRFLTYHYVLANDGVGEGLDGGYWLWTWDGRRFRPQRL